MLDNLTNAGVIYFRLRLLDKADTSLGEGSRIAYCVWACGTLGIESPNLFRLLNQWAESSIESGKPQDTANCIWSRGKLGIEPPNFFDCLTNGQNG